MTLSLAISTIVLVTLLLVLVVMSQRYLLEQHMLTRLEHDAESILQAITFDRNGVVIAESQYLNLTYQRPFSGHYYQIESSTGKLYSRSLWDETWPIGDSTLQRENYRAIGPRDQPLLIFYRQYRKQGENVVIQVAEDLSDIEAEMGSLYIIYGVAALGIIVILISIQQRQLGSALRPLLQSRAQVEALSRGERDRLDQDLPIELLPLVQSLNQTLKLLQQRNQRSSKALGNLAHAIKTPLAALMQWLNQPLIRADAELYQNLNQAAEQIQYHIDRELKRARIVGWAPASERMAWLDAVNDMLQTLETIYKEKEIQVRVSVHPEQIFYGDRQDLYELLGNLLDNAYQWCGSQIKVSLIEESGEQRLRIEDNGPGFKRFNLTERGKRGDESKSGSGLGLAIVRDIVEVYGGKMEIGISSHLGGGEITILLPIPLA